MSKKKHKQNQSLISDETKNKVVSDSQQNATQPDATNPQEHGRSMTEMLGVLAVIGVLSIGGVQGYRYAMNKYHSNEVINELNLLNAQLAVFMNGIHDDEAVMSLGEPYDDARRINTGGYAFDYGCGQDPDSTTPCDLDETGYFMTLDSVPEDVCKSASQMTANMMNLVEQRINGHTDNNGILCQDGDNQLVFLFDANDGQGFDNENDNNPDVTLPKEEEETTTTTTFETTTTTTDTYTKTKTGTYTYTQTGTKTYTYTRPVTYSAMGECTYNNDCASGYYCDITGGNGCNSSGAIGTCKKVSESSRNKPSSAPFWLSSKKMSWWSAINFCEAIGKQLVSVRDYGCKAKDCFGNNSTINAMRSAYGNDYKAWTNTGYDGSSLKTPVPDMFGSDGWLCGDACTSQYYAACKDSDWYAPDFPVTTTGPMCVGYECKDNSDCGTGEYCQITCYGRDYCIRELNRTDDMGGTCKNVNNDLATKPENALFWKSKTTMGWWAAKNFCQALGKTMVSLSDFNCAHSFTDYPYGFCHANTTTAKDKYEETNVSPIVENMISAYGNSSGWTGFQPSGSCAAIDISFNRGYIHTGLAYDTDYALCK